MTQPVNPSLPNTFRISCINDQEEVVKSFDQIPESVIRAIPYLNSMIDSGMKETQYLLSGREIEVHMDPQPIGILIEYVTAKTVQSELSGFFETQCKTAKVLISMLEIADFFGIDLDKDISILLDELKNKESFYFIKEMIERFKVCESLVFSANFGIALLVCFLNIKTKYFQSLGSEGVDLFLKLNSFYLIGKKSWGEQVPELFKTISEKFSDDQNLFFKKYIESHLNQVTDEELLIFNDWTEAPVKKDDYSYLPLVVEIWKSSLSRPNLKIPTTTLEYIISLPQNYRYIENEFKTHWKYHSDLLKEFYLKTQEYYSESVNIRNWEIGHNPYADFFQSKPLPHQDIILNVNKFPADIAFQGYKNIKDAFLHNEEYKEASFWLAKILSLTHYIFKNSLSNIEMKIFYENYLNNFQGNLKREDLNPEYLIDALLEEENIEMACILALAILRNEKESKAEVSGFFEKIKSVAFELGQSEVVDSLIEEYTEDFLKD